MVGCACVCDGRIMRNQSFPTLDSAPLTRELTVRQVQQAPLNPDGVIPTGQPVIW